MSCSLPPEVLCYLEAVEADTPRACPEQHALAAYVRRVFAEEDIRVDAEQLRRYLGLVKYFPFERLPCVIVPTGRTGHPAGRPCCAWWAGAPARTG